MATTSSSSVRPALRVVPPAPVTPLPSRSRHDAHAPPVEPPVPGGGEVSPPPTVSPLARLGASRHPSYGDGADARAGHLGPGRGPAAPPAAGPGEAVVAPAGPTAGGDAASVADPVDLALRRLRRALDTGSGEVDRLLAQPGRRRRRGPAVRLFGDFGDGAA